MSRSHLVTGATHQTYAALLRLTRRPASDDVDASERDRGAVSLEQVLWFVAAGVSVAVVAGILWTRLRDEDNNAPIDQPTAP